LRGPLPRDFVGRLTGTTVRAVTRRAKYLVAELSSGETLLMHLGMSGWFSVDRDERVDGVVERSPDPHDHVVFRMSSGATVTFNDPRRFGLMDLVGQGALPRHPVLSTLGPEPLSPEFDGRTLARACKGKTIALKVALLDQRVVAGLGNIYASEALHRARLSPLRRASTIATPSGLPRESARRLAAAIKQVLTQAIDRVWAEANSSNASEPTYRRARFRVYDRAGEPCLRPRCGGTIKRIEQAGRSTFYCPRCQR
jgi:formamidopyrimidine-DNA glycosylase